VIATGPNIKRALWLASEVETVARQYHLSLTIGGGDIIPDDEINRIIEGFKAYGPLAKPAAPVLKKPAKKTKAKKSPF
jgi:L-fuculose-phosphate aldolase